VPVEALVGFVNLFGRMLPKYLLYSIFFTTMLITYILIHPYNPVVATEYVATLIFGVCACIVMWYETIIVWLRRPF